MGRARDWLTEDRAFEDATSRAVIPEDAAGRGRIVAKEELVAAGLEAAASVLREAGCIVDRLEKEGVAAQPGATLLEVHGHARDLLGAERVALNLVMHLSGVATLTARVVERVRAANASCVVLATRKTTPGLRELEHAAVVAGGGAPHRRDLREAVLVKENHLRFVSIVEAVAAARQANPGLFVMVEAETPAEALDVARARADGVLLDNFAARQVRDTVELVKRLKPDIVVEASGGLTLENVAEYARYVDRVSIGALTHSAPAVDVSMEIEPFSG